MRKLRVFALALVLGAAGITYAVTKSGTPGKTLLSRVRGDGR